MIPLLPNGIPLLNGTLYSGDCACCTGVPPPCCPGVLPVCCPDQTLRFTLTVTVSGVADNAGRFCGVIPGLADDVNQVSTNSIEVQCMNLPWVRTAPQVYSVFPATFRNPFICGSIGTARGTVGVELGYSVQLDGDKYYFVPIASLGFRGDVDGQPFFHESSIQWAPQSGNRLDIIDRTACAWNYNLVLSGMPATLENLGQQGDWLVGEAGNPNGVVYAGDLVDLSAATIEIDTSMVIV